MQKSTNTNYQVDLPKSIAYIFDQLGDIDLLYNQLEYSPQPVLITDTGGKMVYVNKKMLELTGYSRNELIGQNPNIFKSGAQPEDFYNQLWNHIRKGEAFESRFKNQRKDGSLYWVYSTIKPLKNSTGEVSGYISIQEDITNLVKVENRSITSEALLGHLMKNLSKTGIIVIEKDSLSVYMAEGELIHELFPDGITQIDKLSDVFVHKKFHIKNAIAHVCKTHETLRKKINYYHRTLDISIQPLSFGESSQIYCNILIRDVSEYQHIIEKVRHSEQQLEAIFQNAGIGIGILDTKGNYIRLNSGWEQMIGYASEGLLQMNVRELIHQDDLKKYKPELQQLNKGVIKKYRQEIRFIKNDGKILWGDVSLTRITNNKGNTAAIIAVVSDITDKKNVQEALRVSEQQYKDLNATKDRLFSILAHDLKNPFSSIIGLSELAIESPEDTSHQTAIEFLEAINKTANQAHNLLQNLLEWSRIQTGAIAPSLVHSDLFEIIEQTIELVHTMADNKKVNIKNYVEPHTFVLCDIEMMKTIVRNLLSNAIKYSYPDNNIVVDAYQKNNLIVLQIADNGMGMSQETISGLFQIDKQTSIPGTDNEKGTGLGLLLVKDFVTLNKGEIDVQSTVGEGTTFIIKLQGIKNPEKVHSSK